MTAQGIITAIIVGAIVGALGRLVLPGRQHISVLLTIVVGIVAALLGSFIAGQLGVFAVEDEVDSAVPGLDHLSCLVDLAPDVFVGEQVAEEDRAPDASELVECLVGLRAELLGVRRTRCPGPRAARRGPGAPC